VHQTLQCKISPLLLQVRESFRNFAGERNFDDNGFARRKREMFKNCPFHRKIWPSRDCCVFVFVLEFEEKTRHFCQEISAAMTGKSPSQNHKITQNHTKSQAKIRGVSFYYITIPVFPFRFWVFSYLDFVMLHLLPGKSQINLIFRSLICTFVLW